MTALLTDNLPLLAGAPNGIKKLRELILELAVRGKLVPQDPNDEPASELLKRIAVEKARLVAEGKIKKQKLLTEITPEERPFDLPVNWEWVRVAAVGHDWGQKTPDQEFTYIDVGSVDNAAGLIRSPQVVTAEDAPSRARKVVRPGTVIYSTIRPYLLNVAVIDEQYEQEPIASTAFSVIHPYLGMPSQYFLWYLRSPVFVRYVESVQMGIAYPAINDGQFFSGLIPLPPLAEQLRIVAKVDELMALCDRLEAQQADAENAHAQLVHALLDSLIKASVLTARDGGNAGNAGAISGQDFATSWQRLAEHFHTLFTTEPSIDALKQNLLQLAVMGKLVPQDPSDEPASELLKRIAEERARYVAGRRSAKQAALPSIDDTEKAFELASGWEWVRLQQIISVSSGDGLVSANMKSDGGIPVYGGNGVTGYHDEKNVDKEALVIGRVGYYCGSIHLTPANAWITDNALIVSFSEENLYKNFLFWLLKGTNLKEQENATAQPVISGRKIYPIVLAIPPLAEQHRIVAKLNQLMALCDQLKTRLTQARQLNEQLASTLVEQAVA